jgi:hypothetical protein
VGDFVDRGPHQRDVLKIARDMCEAETASAVLGNHEFNAIAWAMPDDEYNAWNFPSTLRRTAAEGLLIPPELRVGREVRISESWIVCNFFAKPRRKLHLLRCVA